MSCIGGTLSTVAWHRDALEQRHTAIATADEGWVVARERERASVNPASPISLLIPGRASSFAWKRERYGKEPKAQKEGALDDYATAWSVPVFMGFP